MDTHTFLWGDSEPAKPSTKVLHLCQDRDNDLLLSAASIWEISIKCQLGKLSLSTSLRDILQNQSEANNLQILPILAEHALAYELLTLHHKDPFDRMLIAQALTEGVVIASLDPVFAQYPATIVW